MYAFSLTPLDSLGTLFRTYTECVEAAARDLAVEANATTSSSRGQPPEDTRELTPARSAQVAEEDLRRPLRGLFGPGRLRGPEEEGKGELREEGRRGNRLPTAETRRQPGATQALTRVPSDGHHHPPSPPTDIATHHTTTRDLTTLKSLNIYKNNLNSSAKDFITRVVPEEPDLTMKTQKILEKNNLISQSSLLLA